MQAKIKLNGIDWLLVIGLMLLTLLYAFACFDFSLHPAEDAAIIMRYAKHIAGGYGIVWNIGERPVDGATDFLYMMLLAILNKAGISLELAVRLVGFVSHILTVAIIYIAIRKLHGINRWVALIPAIYLAIGPAIAYIVAFFGTPFFTLFTCITWCLAYKLIKGNNSHIISLIFALSALVMGLIRPEGVFLAIFILSAILYVKGFKESKRVLLYFIVTFTVLGGLYFFWRWRYFGYPLPNTFYKKGGGYLYYSNFWISFYNLIRLVFPFILIFIYCTLALITTFVLAKLSRISLEGRDSYILNNAKQTIFTSIPIFGFSALWVLLSNEMNYLSRFQYPILPIILISWPPLLKGISQDWKFPKINELGIANQIRLILFIMIIFFVSLVIQFKLYRINTLPDGRYDVAVMLNEYSKKNYTIATAEAGLLPLYSNWKAIDTWGLNDQWIVHHGGITESYLELYKPQIIMFHAYFSPMVPPQVNNTWDKMVMTLKNYAQKNKYFLAAAFGETPYDTHYYYIRTDFPESADIIKRIQGMNYSWYISGKTSFNYAKFNFKPGGP